MPSMPGMRTPTPAPTDAASAMPMGGMTMDGAHIVGMRGPDMAGLTDLAAPMSSEGSGTSWVPRATPLFGWMQQRGADMLMEHGAVFPRFVDTGSLRGSRRYDAPNWFMAMGSHAFGDASQLGVRAMLSADALTENVAGYPLLFQTGETAYGVPLHDRQHPHDLVSELSLAYSRRLGGGASAYAYVGYPGEPALGPPTYMHRPIAYDLADAPIGHHWMDATHIQFGVATLGLAPSRRVKLEASTFTGREPNEIRTNFDPIHLDSASTRLSWSPSDEIATHVSYAFIASPEATASTVNQHRLTASVLFDRALDARSSVYAALIYGQDIESGGRRTNAYLAEGEYRRGRETVFARVELGTRTARDLAIPNLDPESIVMVGAATFGAIHDLTRNDAATAFGIGTAFTLDTKSAALGAAYGNGTPVGFQLYLRMRPPEMRR